ncbi:swi5-dependent recombination DNA repair protein 1 homolog [Aplochiton taeniatus]
METTPKTNKSDYAFDTVESSPSDCAKTRQQPSASLKERLKRSRRSFTSPVSVAKRLCVDEEDDVQQAPAEPKCPGHSLPLDRQDVHTKEAASEINVRKRVPGPTTETALSTSTELLQLRDQLRKEVKERTETQRRLKLVKMYRSKNDLKQLKSLITKWRSSSQAALYELQTELPVDGQKASLSQLMDLFGLDDRLLHYDRSEEDFTDV